MDHKTIPAQHRHHSHHFEFADEAARLAAVVTSDDIYKIAVQLSPQGMYWLASVGPAVWVAFGAGSESTPELPPTGTAGAVLQKLANGVRWIDELDGGNASGFVSYPTYGYPPPPPPPPGSWAPGQTDFDFPAGTYTPSGDFTFP